MPAVESGTGAATDAEPATGVPWRSPTLLAVLLATLVTPMDVPLVSPALTQVTGAFGITESRAGLLATVYALPGIVLAPVVGLLADRLGRRPVLTACLVVFGTAGTAIAFTGSFRVALALRFVQGLAAGSVLSALAMTVVGDTYTGQRHDAVIGVTTATLSLGTALYPAVGGALATVSWNAPFALHALAILLAPVVYVALGARESAGGAHESAAANDDRSVTDDHHPAADGDPPATDGGYVRGALRAVPLGRAAALYGAMFLTYVVLFGGLYTALPFHLGDAFGFGPSRIGLLTSAVLLVTAAVSMGSGRVTPGYHTSTVVGVGFACFTVGLLGSALAGSVAVLVASLLVFGVGTGLVVPTLFGRLSALAPAHVRGGVMSLQTTTIGASQALGPLAFTLAGGAVGYQSLLLGASAATAFVAVSVPLTRTLPG